MKRQYLGDAKDSFKWDYHDFLTSTLGYPRLDVVWMLTPDDGTGQGQIEPSRFPARPEVLRFCEALRRHRRLRQAGTLPAVTGAAYAIRLHGGERFFRDDGREAYFSATIEPDTPQLILLDPDNGFEPKRRGEKHVAYQDVRHMLQRAHPETVVSVFQHHRRRRFSEDFADIGARLQPLYTTAIHWHALMFVAVSRSRRAIEAVATANAAYARRCPVKALGGACGSDMSPARAAPSR